jgi:NAD/NADP transhydrogenase alpha subunit
MVGSLLVGLAVVSAAAAWLTFFAVGIDEDCGRLDECALPVEPLYFVALGLTALAVLIGFVVLLRWVRRGRAEDPARHAPPPTR